MFREAENFLHHWLAGKRRKPLVLRGARQVGKTELVRQFAANKELKLAEINLERYLYLNEIFKTLSLQNISREIESITECALDPSNTLLFLDEIQATPFALQALRYFYEEKPNLPVIAAGSLLEFSLKDHNFPMPVGRIEYFHLGPMSFKEFLKAIDGYLVRFITEYKVGGSIPESAHKKLLERQREYLFTGGMPEAILIFKETNSLKEVSTIHRSITNTYLDDFSKYAKQKDLVLLQKVFRAIPKMIGRKVKYSNFSKEDRSKDIRYCIDLLSKALICSLVHHSICSGIPLSAEINENIYKIIFLDIGLVNHICGLDWLTISSYDTLQLINEGYLAEQFIGQHLLYRSKGIHAPGVVYWLREGQKANAEIDYVISQGDYIVPIEVKAGKSGSLKSLFHFVYKKQSKLAVRFDLNPPSIQQAEHILFVDNKKRKVSFPLFSLPLYIVEELPRLIDEMRRNNKVIE